MNLSLEISVIALFAVRSKNITEINKWTKNWSKEGKSRHMSESSHLSESIVEVVDTDNEESSLITPGEMKNDNAAKEHKEGTEEPKNNGGQTSEPSGETAATSKADMERSTEKTTEQKQNDGEEKTKDLEGCEGSAAAELDSSGTETASILSAIQSTEEPILVRDRIHCMKSVFGS